MHGSRGAHSGTFIPCGEMLVAEGKEVRGIAGAERGRLWFTTASTTEEPWTARFEQRRLARPAAASPDYRSTRRAVTRLPPMASPGCPQGARGGSDRVVAKLLVSTKSGSAGESSAWATRGSLLLGFESAPEGTHVCVAVAGGWGQSRQSCQLTRTQL